MGNIADVLGLDKVSAADTEDYLVKLGKGGTTIRAGNDTAAIRFRPASNDMGAFFVSFFEATDWFLMKPADYESKWEYENFHIPVSLGGQVGIDRFKVDVSQLMDRTTPSTVWEYDALGKREDEWVRTYSLLGTPRLVRWSWVDCYVIRPAFALICSLLNAALYFKQKKEIREWEMFVGKMRGAA